MTFASRLAQLTREKKSNLALLFRPQMAKLPLPIQRYDDPFLPFSRAVIDAAQLSTSIIAFDLAAYLALGAAGAVALERAIAYAGSRGNILSVLHAPFATADYAASTSALAFAPDGVTITDANLIPAYVLRHQAGVFVATSDHSLTDCSTIDCHNGILRVVWQGQTVVLRLFGDSVVYSSVGEDFAAQLTHELETRKRETA